MTVSLHGKAVIVTGSGSGLGAAYARALAAAGASVVVNDVSSEAAGATVSDIEAAGGKAVPVVAAVGSAATAQLLVDRAVSAFGRLDALVTNAGILRDRSLLKMTDDDFDRVVDVHLRGTFTCVRAAYGWFKDHDVAGRIVVIGSPTGQRGTFGQTNYAAAKAGIVGMARTWALETARAGVTVNVVVPVAATAMTRTAPYFAAAIEADDRGEPMPDFYRRDLGFGTADDVAGLVVYLASDGAAGVTGQVIGAGGDRLQLWSHPEPVLSRWHDRRMERGPGRGRVRSRAAGAPANRRRAAPTAPTRARPALRMTTRSRPEIDLEHIEAIDMHVHVEVAADGSTSLPAVLAEAASRYFRSDGAQPDLDSIAQSYRARRMAAVVFTVDARTQLGHQGVSSGEIIRRAADHADVLVPFASVDPHLGERAVDLLRGFAEQGARGFKFHPTLQGFDPSEDRYRPLWHAIAELALPAVVHTGQTGIGAGLPGGAGFKLRYSDPMLLDDVAAE